MASAALKSTVLKLAEAIGQSLRMGLTYENDALGQGINAARWAAFESAKEIERG